MVTTLSVTPIDPSSVPEASGGYHNAVSVEGAQRLLFISGQIPQTPDGSVPADPEDQCRLVWTNIEAVLAEAGMTVRNLMKVTTFLADRKHAAVNTKVRNEALDGHRPALTVIVTGIFDPSWIIEIEAIAAA
ncbi:RidA family protein [Actinoplanes regularis]|uniref:Enamine deaminase RidA, house cleaning of reactive enamine intermediates, YjgF/YER057c/UK114 family n=1 Tax=Actinoplanes regularis TaxID=52697 RepID=A0A239HBX2_9ACTN|nr:RidA family protein [Actinoplanes regularis]GIE90987.1 enamine deaminase RidA [Actinoplanes regularis]SNS78877.1 Enamine deaminase RidA, house cleaning of reactive enamine intermediates, YjgF/YER057c/UK114 family [Actinoplanes regularis]